MFCTCAEPLPRLVLTRSRRRVCSRCAKPRPKPVALVDLVRYDVRTGAEDKTNLAVLRHELESEGLDTTAAVAALLEGEALTEDAVYELREAC